MIPSYKTLCVAFSQIRAITRTTFLESIQQPVAFLMALFSVAMTLLVPVFQFHRFSEAGRLARDSGFSSLLLFGMALAVETAGRSVSGEIGNGTAASALGKPVSRPLFLFSKWLGNMAVVLLFWIGEVAAILIAERASARFIHVGDHAGFFADPLSFLLALGGLALSLVVGAAAHYISRRRFGVTVFWGIALSQGFVVLLSGFYNRLGEWYPVHGWKACLDAPADAAGALFYHPELNLRIIPVALLLLFCLMVFSALATALATRLQPGGVFVVCAGVMLFGLAGDTLLVGDSLFGFKGLLSALLPDLQHFWLCDAIAHGGRVSVGYVVQAGGYALTCSALFLLLGCLAFRGRDLG